MSSRGEAQPARLRLLLDSNVVIALEPYAGALEPSLASAARLVRLANEQGHLLCVAPATLDDLRQSGDVTRRVQRIAELEKFHLLQEPPLEADLICRAGDSPPGTNDHRDLRVLAALDTGGATHLVSDDTRLRRRAARAGLAEAVLSLSEAVELLEGFAPAVFPAPPRVERPKTYTLNREQPIFAGLRADYPDFDMWLNKVRRESDTRTSYLIKDGDDYAAIALLKPEPDCEHDLEQPVTKISTFKVADGHGGVKYGELLLKTIFLEASRTKIATLYVEVLPSHPEVLDFLADFGFEDCGARSELGEHVMVKRLIPSLDDDDETDLEHHIRYGPPALRARQAMYVVPIKPRWHDQLFPECAQDRARTEQLSLFPVENPPLTHPWGNALRKAYLCNSPTKSIVPGDLLLFYRSEDWQAIAAVGIVEDIIRSRSPDEVMTFVGRRTVYTPQEVTAMCRGVGGLLALRFRQDRLITPPWALSELTFAGVLKSWPQSITKVPRRGQEWVRERLDESP